jgi:hypothetical protein
MRVRSPVLLFVALAVAAGPLMIIVPASAQCFGPRTDVSPTRGTPGSTILVEGAGFFDECGDFVICQTVTPSPSPTSTASPTPSPSPTVECEGPDVNPQTGIRVRFLQGGRTWGLAKVDARSNFKFAVEVQVPAAAVPGVKAEIRVLPQNCSQNSCGLVQSFQVVSPLAATGPDVTWPAVAGVAGVAAGLLVLGVSRARSRV